MVFTWQAPVMFMSYSVCAFLGGLTILVCSPFLRGDKWGSGHNVRIAVDPVMSCKNLRGRLLMGVQIAVMYLTAFAGGVTAFVF